MHRCRERRRACRVCARSVRRSPSRRARGRLRPSVADPVIRYLKLLRKTLETMDKNNTYSRGRSVAIEVSAELAALAQLEKTLP